MSHKPLIAISRCLIGDNVRYDAAIKHYPQLQQFIKQHFEIISVCPEVEIGLSVPRPAVQLSGNMQAIKIVGRDDPTIDITADMQQYCTRRPLELNQIQGYIFKSKSPSCGIVNIPIFNSQGQHTEIEQTTRGVFVSAILQHYPQLPITDELGLKNVFQLDAFLEQVKQYKSNT